MSSRKLVSALRQAGLRAGDIVLLHSSFLSLGDLACSPESAVDAFLQVLGKKGTLIVPIFGALGILTEVVKKHPEAVLSDVPLGNIAAIGFKAKEICADHWQCETVHGEGSPYLKIAELGGLVCLLGVDQDRNTSLHSAEALLRLPYLSDKTASASTPDGKTRSKTWKFFPGPHRDFIGLDRYFRQAGIMQATRVGNAVLRLIKAKEMLQLCQELGAKDPAFVLCDNPACADCVRQRAAIFQDRIEQQESFKLAASARLAGNYVPEIIDKLHGCGLKYLELDFLQGRSIINLSPEKLQAAVAEFSAAGINISALRLEFVPGDPEKILALLEAADIKRLIMPLPHDTEMLDALAENRIDSALSNSVEGSAGCKRRFVSLAAKFACSAVFNPVNFVRANEKPFLQSWRIGRFIKNIGQLDIVDATWNLCSTRLARGNAEIKELISILRCHHFSGFFTLGGGAVYPGDLKQAVQDFSDLLDNM
ncbi:MAG: AAC(3) family N-acetyltransferase [Oligosphaeraceae bacterium]|nr:AAC(3) family N-acetyltransferase [Oligosphaeraceae bacterium]